MNLSRNLKAMLLGACLVLSAAAHADTNVTDIWWNPQESGWGATFTQERNGPVFGAIYGYDSAGKATWLTGFMDPVAGSTANFKNRSYSGPLYEMSGGSSISLQAFNRAALTTTPVGTMSFVPDDNEYSGTLTYLYNGATVTKKIERYTISEQKVVPPSAPDTASRAIAQTITNGQCTESFPLNQVANLAFRLNVTKPATGGDVWKVGQCDAGSTTTCPISAPICTYTQTSSEQYGNVAGNQGTLECSVGGTANPLTGGKTGTFKAEVMALRFDDHGISGKLAVQDAAKNCIAVSSFIIKHSNWIGGCSFSSPPTPDNIGNCIR